MDEKEFYQTDEIEIDIGRIFFAIVTGFWLALLVSALTAAAVFGVSRFLLTEKYEASAMFYVNNNSLTANENPSSSISSGDLATSRGLVNSYIVILNTRETLNEVIDYAGLDLKYAQISGMVSASAVDKTEMFRVTVTSEDPKQAEQIANAIAHVLPGRIGSIIDGSSAEVVDWAVEPTSPSSPNYVRNTLIGFLVGFVLCVAVIVMREMLDTTIRSEDDIELVCPHPVLSLVPDMRLGGKRDSHYYGYKEHRKKKKKLHAKTKEEKETAGLIGSNVSFVASEAYKRLRTKLQFSFADDSNCRVIGLSSALSGEGKSLTSINLAYTLAQLNKRVILLDCDMRRPTLAEKMGLNKKPGLSEYLTGQHGFKEVIQRYGEQDENLAFHVISAGESPPNPMEMLSSVRMERLLGSLREAYDYVILDLPPITEVTDAMAVAPKADGMLLVVRQNYCDRVVLRDTVKQFAFIEAKILGVVFNCTSENNGKYLGRVYYTPYYKKYYRRYGKSYGGGEMKRG